MRIAPLADKLVFILLLAVLFSGCTWQPAIHASSAERVKVNSMPKDFLWSFELAKRECEQYEKLARYVPDSASDLQMLVFDCISPEALLAEEAAVEQAEETASETASE